MGYQKTNNLQTSATDGRDSQGLPQTKGLFEKHTTQKVASTSRTRAAWNARKKPTLQPGHKLYVYQVIKREFGLGVQRRIGELEDLLSAQNLAAYDFGFEDIRALCEGMSEFIKLTVFKKGVVYVTLLSFEPFETALQKLEETSEVKKAAKGGGYRKSGKVLKPVKPRHHKPIETQKEASGGGTPSDITSAGTVANSTTYTGSVPSDITPANTTANNTAPTDGTANNTAPIDGSPNDAIASEETDTQESAVKESSSQFSPELLQAIDAQFNPDAHDDAPDIRNIQSSIDDKPQAQPEHLNTKSAPLNVAQSEDMLQESKNIAPYEHLPQNFFEEVLLPSEVLSQLNSIVSDTHNVIEELELAFSQARSLHTFSGTRSHVRFSLPFPAKDGGQIEAVLTRHHRARVGKHWVLSEIVGIAQSPLELDALSACNKNAWEALAPASTRPTWTDPLKELYTHITIRDPEQALAQLAELTKPEPWGKNLEILKTYVCLNFYRAWSDCGFTTSKDGSVRCFDTGLLTTDNSPIYALVSATHATPAWEFAGFMTPSTAPLKTLVETENIELASSDGVVCTGLQTMWQTSHIRLDASPAVKAHTKARAYPIQALLTSYRRALRYNPRWFAQAYDVCSERMVLLAPAVDENLVCVITQENPAFHASYFLQDTQCAHGAQNKQTLHDATDAHGAQRPQDARSGQDARSTQGCVEQKPRESAQPCESAEPCKPTQPHKPTQVEYFEIVAQISKHDAYALARAASSELPSWLTLDC